MKTKRFRIVLAGLLVVALATASSPAGSLRLEGQAFHPDAAISWAAPLKGVPESFIVYKVVPKQFSKEIIARMLKIADFKPFSMKLLPDKRTMQWRARDENGTLIRSLEINPTAGWITYFNSKAEAPSTKAAEGVPSYEEVDKLAMDYLRQLGGDTNQLALSPRSRMSGGRSSYKKQGGDLIREETTMRGTMYARQIDGIRICSAGGRGGLMIDFGNHAKVGRLDLNWRTLQPGQRYRTASAKEIVALIKGGKAVLPEQNVDLNALSQARKFTITKVTPYYWGELGGESQDEVYPFAELEVKADFADANSITFTLFCPILRDQTVEKKN